jgi:hypothetical protein
MALMNCCTIVNAPKGIFIGTQIMRTLGLGKHPDSKPSARQSSHPYVRIKINTIHLGIFLIL